MLCPGINYFVNFGRFGLGRLRLWPLWPASLLNTTVWNDYIGFQNFLNIISTYKVGSRPRLGLRSKGHSHKAKLQYACLLKVCFQNFSLVLLSYILTIFVIIYSHQVCYH